MKRAIPKRPTFFWQGMMMILPVIALAAFGLFALRQDEQNAVRAASQKAEHQVQQLTRALAPQVEFELEQFEKAQAHCVDLFSNESIPPFQKGGWPPSDEEMARLKMVYPGLSADNFPIPIARFVEGEQVQPPPIPSGISPPPWFTGLSPQQRRLWDAISATTNERAEVINDFLATHPPEEARQVLAFYWPSPGAQTVETRFGVRTESGLPLSDIEAFRLLSLRSGVLSMTSSNTDELIRGVLLEHPSFAAPALLDLAEQNARSSEGHWIINLDAIRRYLKRQNTARELAQTLRDAPEFSTWTKLPPGEAPRPLWESVSSDRVLAIFSPWEDAPSATRRPGWEIEFIPNCVLEDIFKHALAQNSFFVPDYASVSMAVEGVDIIAPNALSSKRDADKKSAVFSSKSDGPGQLAFAATLHLDDTDKMLAEYHRRAQLFGALIGAVVLTALAGLLAARRAFYEQARLSEMKSNFVSSVSHELRAPIASMRLLSEALERGKVSDPAKQQEYYRFLVQESGRLTSLIENVLDFSRIEQGRKEYRFETADLGALGGQTVKLLQPYASEHRVALRWLPPEDPTPPLSCDASALQQALINLIDNAVKHSPANAEVRVGLDCSGGLVRLWVEDGGPGIPAEEHEKIFERFYRRGSELRRETQGIGIGLTIVKHIVEAHGGAVRVRSAPAQGSRFTLELPLRPEPA